MQVDASLFPVTLNRPFRRAAHRGDLGERKAAEELEVDNLRERGIDLGQLIERVGDAGDLAEVGKALDDVGAQRGDLELAAALGGLAVS